ncbi:GGDEF domain-containing protein, partial [Klebsiella pneumoniae]|uniref:GGDEF domain-containing protein n=1 Tax=Klebsiella pneumoniae TaxID=573 RepID=UPI003852EA67
FTATMVLAIVTNHRDFVRMELSRQRLARQLERIARESQRNYRRATIDDLTGGLNRRAILTRLRNEVGRAEGPRAWLALVDLDGFKHVND